MNSEIENLISHITPTLQNHFETPIVIENFKLLSEPERRNRIIRLYLASESKSIPKSIILKQSLPEDSDDNDKAAFARFASDWAGLEFASLFQKHAHFVPKFYAGNKEHRFILIEDLGQVHISLVDSLTSNNTEKAIAALQRFMKALGSFHAASFGHTDKYLMILKSINEDADKIHKELEIAPSDFLPEIKSIYDILGLQLNPDVIEEAQSLFESLYNPGPFTVLTHGDICPDNVYDHDECSDLQLIDFEWACVRNALLDGTYLRMSMPTCWCAKAIPPSIIDPLEQLYREELKQTIPDASDDFAYNKAYVESCGFWVLQQTLPFIKSVLDNDRIGASGPTPENSLWKDEENSVRPRVLSRLQAFIDVSAKHNHLPNISKMSSQILYALQKRWPETKFLEFYPAFNKTDC